MKVCGIIAEYNPFHKGHLYHLEEAKRLSGADYIVVIMSGNFVQRGECAIIDKYSRVKMALSQGADLVLELPAIYATGSAEYFAHGAVSILDKLGALTHLCFGSECGDIRALSSIADKLLNETPSFKEALQKELKAGHSFAKARELAFLEAYPEATKYASILSSPNNILALEYLKALSKNNSKLIPITIKREGAGYNDTKLNESFSSASGIRNSMLLDPPLEDLSREIPAKAFQIFKDTIEKCSPQYMDSFSSLLHYKLLLEGTKGFEEYLDVTKDLSDRIRKHIKDFVSFSQFCELLKTKEMAYSRISRCLLHILLDIKTSFVEPFMTDYVTPYARVLGFKREATPLLKAIDGERKIPLITKLADAHIQLEEEAYALLEKEIQISSMYYVPSTKENNKVVLNEYSTPLIIL